MAGGYFSDTLRRNSQLERVAGIEPARSAWEADRLPLHHTRAGDVVSMAGVVAAIGKDERWFEGVLLATRSDVCRLRRLPTIMEDADER